MPHGGIFWSAGVSPALPDLGASCEPARDVVVFWSAGVSPALPDLELLRVIFSLARSL
jgi:hypothetical protein